MECVASVQFKKSIVSEHFNSTLMYANLYVDKDLVGRYGGAVVPVRVK